MINVSDFQVIKKIKQDELGIIYLVKNKKDDDIILAKVLTTDKYPRYKQPIKNMIECLINCKHENIIHYYGYSLTDFDGKDNITLFMEYFKKGCLSDLFLQIQQDKDCINNTCIQKILVGIAKGLQQLNQYHIIHLNLKPQNILLDDNYHPIVSDFDLFKLCSNNSKRKMITDLVYTSPEILEGKSFNEKADVFSFGIIMFEIITKSFPYPSLQSGEITTEQFIKKVVNENYRPQFQFSIKNSIQNLIEKCWSKDPNERPTFEEIFKKLAYNLNDSFFDIFDINTNNNNNNDYYLDKVDIKNVISYANKIDMSNFSRLENENLQLRLKISHLENELLKLTENKNKNKNIIHEKIDMNTIDSFNDLPLQEQQKIISDTIKNSQGNEKYLLFFNKFNRFLLYLLRFNPIKTKKYLKLNTDDMNCSLIDVYKENQIQLYPCLTELLFSDKTFQIEEFVNYIDQINEVLFDFVYPSDLFDKYYEDVKNIKMKHYNVKINAFITKLTDKIKSHGFNYMKFDESITQFSKYEFMNCFVNKVFIPSSITILDEGLFTDCCCLTQVDIPPSVVSIENYAFLRCKKLKHIEIPSSVKFIGHRAFAECQSLISITIPNQVKCINESTFQDCTSLAQINLPSSLVSIKQDAFFNCSSLCNIQIPSSVTSIGSRAFHHCHSLRKIELPSSISIIESSLFYGCNSLIHFVISSSITSIKESSFLGCSSLTKIEIPDSVISIGNMAFDGCSSITEIEIPKSVTSIGEGIFIGCLLLKKIILPSSLPAITPKMFYACRALTSFEVPETITCIGDNAFEECSSLVNITIPSSVKSLGKSVFKGCTSLIQINIPSSINSIGDYSFCNCTSLAKIQLPDTILYIGSYAFSKCSSLAIIEIPSSVMSIGNFAFSECKLLTNVKLPNSLKSIDNSTFEKCSSLATFEFPNSLLKIGDSSFKECSLLARIKLPNSLKSIGFGSFSKCTSLAQVELPLSLETIKSNAFEFTSLTKVKIPPSVITIEKDIFKNCEFLKQISIPSTLDASDLSLPSSVELIKY